MNTDLNPARGTTGPRDSARPADSWPHALRLARRLLDRDYRAGELRMLIVALIVAIAAMATVGFFTNRLDTALQLQATQLLGADLVIASDRRDTSRLRDEAARRGLKVSGTAVFPSMVMSDGNGGDELGATQLASVKVVEPGYPLRGELQVEDAAGQRRSVAARPDPGTAWVDVALLHALKLNVGDPLLVGERRLNIARSIVLEPDRGASFANVAPRVMIAHEDLESTHLVQPGSRIAWQVLIAGDYSAVRAFEDWARRNLARGQDIQSLEGGGRRELRTTLDRARQFLSLVSLLSALIASVAIGLAARRFVDRHVDAFAVMRSFGASRAMLSRALAFEMLAVTLLAGVIGAAIGWGAHWVLVRSAATLVEIEMPPPSLMPAVQALLAGVVLMLGFALFPILRLARVPPLRVLRRELGAPGLSAALVVLIALLAFGVLVLWYAGDLKLGLYALGGFVLALLIFSGLAMLGVVLLAPARQSSSGRSMGALRLAIASWARRRNVSVVQTAALSIGLMALMLLTVTRNDLLQSWQRASPADAPNRFALNVQPDQRNAFEQMLSDAGVRNAPLYPMIRGRLVSVNGTALDTSALKDERARRLAEREFNLSYMNELPGHNRVDAGRWIDPSRAEVSGEEGIMKTLNLKIGDRLQFDVAGELKEMDLVGSRKLAWDSMRVNFFMIASPRVLEDAPQSWITSFRAPGAAGEAEALSIKIVSSFPNVSVIDVGAILAQVQATLSRVSEAVQFLFLFALVAGLVVLQAALASSRDERVQEAAVLRALGASRARLLKAQVLELALTGAVAGLLAAIGGLAVGWVLAARVFEFPYHASWWLLPLGPVLGATITALAGYWGLRSVVQRSPIEALRSM